MAADDSAIRLLCERAKHASRALAQANSSAKDQALHLIARKLEEQASSLIEANAVDLERVRLRGGTGETDAFVDRLRLTAARITQVARAVEVIAGLEDPVGEVPSMRRRPNGLLVGRVRVPLGVIAMVYEARPNVTVDAASLCIKSGNAVILRGGSEASHSNEALGTLVRECLSEVGLPADAVQLLPPGERDHIRVLLGMTGLVDLAIPRGGEGLVRFVTENARVPVVQHYQGVCHLYADAGCSPELVLRLIVDGKTVRPGVCNALECLLVHAREAASLLPQVARMAESHRVELRGCPRTREIVPGVTAAAPSDFGHEFLDKILAIQVVDDLDGALAHVARYGSGHTEVICTNDYTSSQRWLREVDASCVLVNASSRFNDGGELGLGAEIGISTSKLHAYGPMGLESLTTQKWIVYGEGQVRG